MSPRPRKPPVVVTVRIEGLDYLARAIVKAATIAADARRYEADVRGGLIRPKEEAPPREPESVADIAFAAWIGSKDDLAGPEREEMEVFWERVNGTRPSNHEQMTRAWSVLRKAGAPLPGNAPI